MAAPGNPKLRHVTADRGFAILVGLFTLTLYVAGTGHGAAPTSPRFPADTWSEEMPFNLGIANFRSGSRPCENVGRFVRVTGSWDWMICRAGFSGFWDLSGLVGRNLPS